MKGDATGGRDLSLSPEEEAYMEKVMVHVRRRRRARITRRALVSVVTVVSLLFVGTHFRSRVAGTEQATAPEHSQPSPRPPLFSCPAKPTGTCQARSLVATIF
ncbi:hypothetical protein D7Y21_09710 [Corallococcus sp. AB045]|nr:hypothetical protein D7Y21_09710 [Corallococcus sp. AB045]